MRKYQYYVIKINYHNGESEELNTFKANKDINNSSYKEMLNVYNEVKELYKDKECNIEFYGVGQDGALSIMFVKECKQAIIENNSHEQGKDIYYIYNLLKEACNLYYKRRETVSKLIPVLDKERDSYNHDILSLPKNISDKEKIRIYDLLKDANDKRRDLKDEEIIFDEISKNRLMGAIHLKLDDMNAIIQEKINFKEKIKTDEYIKEKAMKNTHVNKFDYKDFKDRIRLMKKLKKEYDKVILNESEKQIIAYNKCACVVNK